MHYMKMLDYLFKLIIILVYVSTAKNLPIAERNINRIQQLQNGLKDIWLHVDIVKQRMVRTPPMIKENPKIDSKFVNSPPSNCHIARLVVDDNYMYLAVRKDNKSVDKFRGVENGKLGKEEGIFQIQSYGKSIVRIFDTKSKKYLSMTRRGEIRAVSDKNNDDTLFKTTFEENNYHRIASHKYFVKETHDYFVSVGYPNGQVISYSDLTEKVGRYQLHFMYFYKGLEDCSCGIKCIEP